MFLIEIYILKSQNKKFFFIFNFVWVLFVI